MYFYYVVSFPSCFATCGHHLPSSIAIVFSLQSSVSNSSMSHSSISIISSNHPVPRCTFHILLLCELYSRMLCHTGTSVHLFPLSAGYWYPFLPYGRSRSPTRIRSFGVFAKSFGPCKCFFIPNRSLKPPYISDRFPDFTLFFSASLPFCLSLLLHLVCTSQTSLWTSSLVCFLQYPSILSQLRYPTTFQLALSLYSPI